MSNFRPILVLTLACLIPFAGGWGRKGHSVIAHIAYLELTPEAKARVDAIMGDQTIQETASWADGVRGRGRLYPETGPLHYANLAPYAPSYDHAAERPEAGNVVDGVVDYALQIEDPDLSDELRRHAMMFMVHFAGDLHQPLHAGNADDRGGNDIDINWFDGERRLHSIWDSGIIDATTQDPWPLMADRLYKEISDEDRMAWTITDPDTVDRSNEDDAALLTKAVGRWVLESRRYANDFAYAAQGFHDGKAFEDGTELGQRYATHCEPVINLRLKQAGVRLGHVLNAILGDGAVD